jgi:diadenosine tetraphosphate (Ap4A) HIT family hydrolase
MSESTPDHCLFCEVPPRLILEATQHAFVILDAYPVSPGHTLVISRRHVMDIFDLTESEIADILRLIRSARERLDRTLKPSGYNIGVNVGRAAGQTVMHVHIHVIPRYTGDVSDPTGGVRGVIPGRARYSRSSDE